ncbi:MAG TPA: hypothetical protein VKB38_00380 [Terracidiphilus sp.]|nr:hypothetical protein [Terracidiphilus sp.]
MSAFMTTVCGWVVCGFIAFLAGTIIWFIWKDKIDLSALVSETNGDASLSRFQLLIFTFVVAISLFYLVEKRTDGTFPDIPSGVLTLVGISASTYAVGKGISYSRDEGVTSPEERESVRQTAQALSGTGATAAVSPAATVTTGAAQPQPPVGGQQ